jgi:hypothetical protein
MKVDELFAGFSHSTLGLCFYAAGMLAAVLVGLFVPL